MGSFVGPITLTLTASDEESGVDQTYISFDEGDSWLSYTEAIALETSGAQFIKYYSTDQAGNKENPQSRALWVSEESEAPELLSIGNQLVEKENLLAFTASIKYALNLGSVTFSLSNAPPGAVINPDSGRFEWTPSVEQAPGLYTVTVVVTDGVSSDSQPVSITVTGSDSASTFAGWAEGILNSAQRSVSDCPAGDGIPNLLKYAIGLDPSTPNSTSDLFVYAPNSNGNFTVTFRKTKTATDVVLVPIWTASLSHPNWKTITQCEQIGSDGTTEIWQATLPENTYGFVRLQAHMNDFVYWSTTQITDPTQRGNEDSPAGDGVANLMKYAIGLDPATPSSTADLFTYAPNSNGNFTVTFRKSKSAADVTLVPIWTASLSQPDWKIITQCERIGSDETTETWQATLPADSGGFIRLQAHMDDFVHWAETTITDPSQRGTEDSPAGDGVANLMKYAIGFDPETDHSSADLFTTSVDSNDTIIVDFQKSKAATDVTLEVIWRPSLTDSNWQVVQDTEKTREDSLIEYWRAILPEGEVGYVRLRVQ